MPKHKQPQGIKLHEILAQCADPKATGARACDQGS